MNNTQDWVKLKPEEKIVWYEILIIVFVLCLIILIARLIKDLVAGVFMWPIFIPVAGCIAVIKVALDSIKENKNKSVKINKNSAS